MRRSAIVKCKILASLGLAVLVLAGGAPRPAAAAEKADIVVLISANAEWKPVRARLAALPVRPTPYGEFIAGEIRAGGRAHSAVYFHGGWGKISAAASAQYAIGRWTPRLLVNLGTCGGFEGAAKVGDVLLVTRTVVYDIVEMMGDADAAIADYSTTLDLAWLRKPYPTPVVESLLVSADRDLQPADIPRLRAKYGAAAGDWETGAIAWTAARSKTPCLILRAVSDIVSTRGSEAYGNLALFEEGTRTIMGRLFDLLPAWIRAAETLFGGAS
jgi:adenosylhomocysteine nucleosidase